MMKNKNISNNENSINNLSLIKKFIELSDDEYVLNQEDELVVGLMIDQEIKIQSGIELIAKAYRVGLPQTTSSNIFNPFKDFYESGYLRNVLREKDLRIVKKLEQVVFCLNFEKATQYISSVKSIGCNDVYQVHKVLFSDLYPWAGKSRKILVKNESNMEVSKGNIGFLTPGMIEHSLNLSLVRAQKENLKLIKNSPGSILGELAYIHPFLDGNGRTILMVVNELCTRANRALNWDKFNRIDYLTALTKEIDDPRFNAMNNYLLV